MLTGRRLGLTPSIGWPSMMISPSVGISKPASMRSKVVLPQPDGPSSAKNSPSRISNETLSTALTFSPNSLVTSLIEMMGWALTIGFGLLVGTTLDPQGEDREGQRQDDEDGRGGVDFRRHAETDHGIDLDREGGRARAGREEGDHEVVE